MQSPDPRGIHGIYHELPGLFDDMRQWDNWELNPMPVLREPPRYVLDHETGLWVRCRSLKYEASLRELTAKEMATVVAEAVKGCVPTGQRFTVEHRESRLSKRLTVVVPTGAKATVIDEMGEAIAQG